MKRSPVTLREHNALLNWQSIHGRHWRAELLRAWGNGDYGHLYSDDEARLQGLRNRLGPMWLATYSLKR